MAKVNKNKLPEVHIDIGSHNYRSNPSGEARELALFIENDADLYRQQTVPIINNLAKKFAKGTYDHAKAIVLWKHLADNGAKKYTFEFDERGNARYWQQVSGFGIFTPAIRKEAAAILADSYFENINGDNPLVQAKKNPAPRIGTAKPRRRSQITGKAPSKRLVTRRKANTRKGYFPNPIGEGKLAVWLNAGNDTNGNPRRLFVVVDTRGQILSVHDEGYYGESAVTQHYPGIGIVGQFSITPAQYRELRKKEK